MGKLVSQHMTSSIKTSAHVQSFIEADVTKIWNWRKQVKDDFFKREGENLTLHQFLWKQLQSASRLSNDEYFCKWRSDYKKEKYKYRNGCCSS